MLRKIITIDQEKCNGCGLCAQACHEQAIGMVDGKAALLRDDYCDGLGDCLPVCPTNAITFEVREAAAYDEAAVLANKASQEAELPCGCPGTQARLLHQQEPAPAQQAATPQNSELQQWPVQIKLVNPHAPYLQNSRLLVAADCTAFAYGDFHRSFIRGRITLIGCPKLDSVDYSEKLRSCLQTISKALPSSAWKYPAAAVWNRRSEQRCSKAVKSSPGRSPPSAPTVRFWKKYNNNK